MTTRDWAPAADTRLERGGRRRDVAWRSLARWAPSGDEPQGIGPWTTSTPAPRRGRPGAPRNDPAPGEAVARGGPSASGDGGRRRVTESPTTTAQLWDVRRQQLSARVDDESHPVVPQRSALVLEPRSDDVAHLRGLHQESVVTRG